MLALKFGQELLTVKARSYKCLSGRKGKGNRT